MEIFEIAKFIYPLFLMALAMFGFCLRFYRRQEKIVDSIEKKLCETIAKLKSKIDNERISREKTIENLKTEITSIITGEQALRKEIHDKQRAEIDELFRDKVSKDVCVAKHQWNGKNRRGQNDKDD